MGLIARTPWQEPQPTPAGIGSALSTLRCRQVSCFLQHDSCGRSEAKARSENIIFGSQVRELVSARLTLSEYVNTGDIGVSETGTIGAGVIRKRPPRFAVPCQIDRKSGCPMGVTLGDAAKGKRNRKRERLSETRLEACSVVRWVWKCGSVHDKALPRTLADHASYRPRLAIPSHPTPHEGRCHLPSFGTFGARQKANAGLRLVPRCSRTMHRRTPARASIQAGPSAPAFLTPAARVAAIGSPSIAKQLNRPRTPDDKDRASLGVPVISCHPLIDHCRLR